MDELVERLKQKEEAALKEVMRMYKKPIFNYLNLLLGNRETAEELAQDTFVKVYFKAHTLEADDLTGCRAWIYAIASNLARSEFRKRKLQRWFSMAELRENHAAVAGAAENGLLVEQMLGRIPDKYRLPLVMKEIDNFSFEEIAVALKKPVGTIKSLVFRGKAQLKNAAACQGDTHE